jgi:hypothetical protein
MGTIILVLYLRSGPYNNREKDGILERTNNSFDWYETLYFHWLDMGSNSPIAIIVEKHQKVWFLLVKSSEDCRNSIRAN